MRDMQRTQIEILLDVGGSIGLDVLRSQRRPVGVAPVLCYWRTGRRPFLPPYDPARNTLRFL